MGITLFNDHIVVDLNKYKFFLLWTFLWICMEKPAKIGRLGFSPHGKIFVCSRFLFPGIGTVPTLDYWPKVSETWTAELCLPAISTLLLNTWTKQFILADFILNDAGFPTPKKYALRFYIFCLLSKERKNKYFFVRNSFVKETWLFAKC